MSDNRLAKLVPSIGDYNRVTVAAGLSEKSVEAARLGLANTVFGVCAENRGKAVGIGRVVGDGGLFFEVVDIASSASSPKKACLVSTKGTVSGYARRRPRVCRSPCARLPGAGALSTDRLITAST